MCRYLYCSDGDDFTSDDSNNILKVQGEGGVLGKGNQDQVGLCRTLPTALTLGLLR